MAAPVLRSVTAPAISTGAVTSPSSTQIGDLIVFVVWSQGTAIPTHTLQSGFTTIRTGAHDDGTTDGRLSVAIKEATLAGAQSYTPYTVSGATAGQTSVGCVVYQAGTWSRSVLTVTPPNNGASLTTNAVPNPPSVNGLTGDFVVLAIAGWHVTTAAATAATAPTNYTITTQNASASHVTHVAVASRTLTGLSGATEDAAAFGDNVAPNGSAAFTIALPGIVEQVAGTLAASGASAAAAAATRETAAGTLAEAGVSAVVTDGTVENGGASHDSGALASSGACTVSVTATREATSGALVVVGGAGIAATATRGTFGTPVVSVAASVTAVGTRATFAGALAAAAIGAGACAATRGTFAGALAATGASSAVVTTGSTAPACAGRAGRAGWCRGRIGRAF